MDERFEKNLSQAMKEFTLASIRDAIGHAADDICTLAATVREREVVSGAQMADDLTTIAAAWERGADEFFGDRT